MAFLQIAIPHSLMNNKATERLYRYKKLAIA